MARTYGWRKAAAAVLTAAAVFACTEQVTAPGRCPDLCPSDSLQIVDTVITGVIFGDTSIRGYTRVDQLPILIAADEDTFQARGLIRFASMPKFWLSSAGDSVYFGGVDSVVFTAHVSARDTLTRNLRLLLYKIPGDSLDSTATYPQALPWFTFGDFLDSVPVLDTSKVADLTRCWKPVADTLCATLGVIASMLPDTVQADTMTPGIGIAVRADSQTAAVVAATDFTATPAHLKYYVHGLPPNDTMHTLFDLVPSFDTYVSSPAPLPIAPQTIVVGNQPAARAFVHFQIPTYYVDTVGVSRATVLLTPLRPPTGFPHATFGIESVPVVRYFGGKSLLNPDTTLIGTGTVTVGSTSTVQLEVGAILRSWKGANTDSVPRIISIRLSNEQFDTGEFAAYGSAGGASAPRLELSFVRPLKFGVP